MSVWLIVRGSQDTGAVEKVGTMFAWKVLWYECSSEQVGAVCLDGAHGESPSECPGKETLLAYRRSPEIPPQQVPTFCKMTVLK